jgi:hypothetical protein
MTLQQVLNSIDQFGNNFVQITLTNDRVIRGVLQNAYEGHPQDPRGYTEPYFFVVRIDLADNPTDKYNCEEAIEITKVN